MKKTFLVLFFLVHVTVFAQVSITFPVNRAVFQRNGSNTGVIPIGGTFQARVEKIEARLTPINGGNFVDWTAIAVNPNYGTFIGGIYAQAGWYKLEIRASFGGNIIGTSSIEKVGIGEVFIVSGQSNAQGYEGRGNLPAYDDRVNCITNFYSYGQITEPPFPIISQLSENAKIAPLGNGSWCWGKLGDLLTTKLNAPVLFINTGFEAMGIEAWSKSADGERGQDFYSGNFALPGYPYENLKKSLHYYANMFGVRSVLWHQGETDNDKKTSTEKYRKELEYIIDRSRGDTGKNISWMISRVSRVSSGTYQPVIDAQNQVIQSYPNTFAGPETDAILTRTDGVHFYGDGLVQFALAWNEKLDFNFFSKSIPIPSSSPLFFDLRCNTENKNTPFRIFMPNGFKEYYWTNGFGDIAKAASIETNTGFYRGRAIDYLGNVYYTPGVNYISTGVAEKPSIFVEGDTKFCDGQSVKMTSSTDNNIFWSTGENTQSITVSKAGNYTVSQVNFLNCFVYSDGVSVEILPSPEAKIFAEGNTEFCSGGNVTLRSNTISGNTWSTGDVNSAITVNRSGDYFVTVKNEYGCENNSSKINVRVNPLPEKPIITADGPTIFCSDKSVNLISNIGQNIRWNTGDQTSSVRISGSGEYFVTITNEFGCVNTSNAVPIKVNPLPQKPVITPNGPTTFCDGDAVTLTATSSNSYEWSNSKTLREQTINSTGYFSVKIIDENGCVSAPSDELKVTVKPSPLGISILQTGTYTLEALTNGLYDTKFEWYKDDVLLKKDSVSIKVNGAGIYKVRGSILYNLENGGILRCFSEPSTPHKFTINSSNQGLSVFPNPAPNSKINIETLEDHQEALVSVYDLKGVLLSEYSILKFDSRKTFDLTDLPKGGLLISVKAKDFNVIKRVFIE